MYLLYLSYYRYKDRVFRAVLVGKIPILGIQGQAPTEVTPAGLGLSLGRSVGSGLASEEISPDDPEEGEDDQGKEAQGMAKPRLESLRALGEHPHIADQQS